ncbi:hypothetical protein HanIR_Chr01g0005371 [Helianthus annuus]|nr:hypothetical protein HanIR_Chr01g0005371 [Helianthus annuus]
MGCSRLMIQGLEVVITTPGLLCFQVKSVQVLWVVNKSHRDSVKVGYLRYFHTLLSLVSF